MVIFLGLLSVSATTVALQMLGGGVIVLPLKLADDSMAISASLVTASTFEETVLWSSAWVVASVVSSVVVVGVASFLQEAKVMTSARVAAVISRKFIFMGSCFLVMRHRRDLMHQV